MNFEPYPFEKLNNLNKNITNYPSFTPSTLTTEQHQRAALGKIEESLI